MLSQPTRMFLQALGTSDEAALLGFAATAKPDTSILEQIASLDPVFRGSSNGSVFQYQHFFPDDLKLKELCDLVVQADIARRQAA